jgi:hypothetical protein
VLDELRRRFPEGNVEESKGALRLGTRTLAARRLRVEIAGIPMSMDVATFDAPASTWAVIVQDTVLDDGSPSAETVRVKELLASTFTGPEAK